MLGFINNRKFLLPVASGLTVALLVAGFNNGFGVAKQQATLMLPICNDVAKKSVRLGEQALARHDLAQAEDYAKDATIVGEKCSYAYELLAATKYQVLLSLPKRADPATVRAIRTACFEAAEKAKALYDSSPRNEMTAENCAAENAYRTSTSFESGRLPTSVILSFRRQLTLMGGHEAGV
jgi:hypothetical protein